MLCSYFSNCGSLSLFWEWFLRICSQQCRNAKSASRIHNYPKKFAPNSQLMLNDYQWVPCRIGYRAHLIDISNMDSPFSYLRWWHLVLHWKAEFWVRNSAIIFSKQNLGSYISKYVGTLRVFFPGAYLIWFPIPRH